MGFLLTYKELFGTTLSLHVIPLFVMLPISPIDLFHFILVDQVDSLECDYFVYFCEWKKICSCKRQMRHLWQPLLTEPNSVWAIDGVCAYRICASQWYKSNRTTWFAPDFSIWTFVSQGLSPRIVKFDHIVESPCLRHTHHWSQKLPLTLHIIVKLCFVASTLIHIMTYNAHFVEFYNKKNNEHSKNRND